MTGLRHIVAGLNKASHGACFKALCCVRGATTCRIQNLIRDDYAPQS
jgi:hypothetical protein